MATKEDFFLLVAAIDFGTAYSGYAFSSKEEFKRDPLKISSYTWQAGKLMSLKTVTCVLFDKNKKFHSFGYEAEDKYVELARNGKHGEWYFFKRFKMELFDKLKLKRKFLLEEEMGKRMQAVEVFSASLRYMKDHLLDNCRNQLPDISVNDIRWVLTVPAIWNDSSKQFMREAAETAGLDGDKLLIALEPEAASLCCRHLPINATKGTQTFAEFREGAKYLIFDAGGGTIDITVHQVQPGGSLKELYKANGGSWGGIYVDKAFRNFLSDIVGNDIIDNFQATNMEDYIDLFRDFETIKRQFKVNMESKVNIRVPVILHEEFKKTKNKDIKDEIESRSQYKGKISWTADKLRIEPSIAKDLFSEAISSITRHLYQLFQDGSVKDVPTILMVGGFSESPMLQDIMKETFPRKKIIIPSEPGLAVLKGAVIFGHDPSVIKERRCRHTYGVQTSIPFDCTIHPLSGKFQDDSGEDYCGGIFDRHVKIGQQAVCGESQYTGSYVPTKKDAQKISFIIYESSEENPMFVSTCTKLGTLDIDIEGYGQDRPVNVQMFFSGTELEVTATEAKTGKKTKAKFDFLE